MCHLLIRPPLECVSDHGIYFYNRKKKGIIPKKARKIKKTEKELNMGKRGKRH
jgi:hypothetical protein